MKGSLGVKKGGKVEEGGFMPDVESVGRVPGLRREVQYVDFRYGSLMDSKLPVALNSLVFLYWNVAASAACSDTCRKASACSARRSPNPKNVHILVIAVNAVLLPIIMCSFCVY